MRRVASLVCMRCGCSKAPDHRIDSRGCEACDNRSPANFRVSYHVETPSISRPMRTMPSTAIAAAPSLWRYADRLPFDESQAISLGEGLTPLLPAPRIAGCLQLDHLLIKDETRQPTGSYKDRFSTVIVSAARAAGIPVVATSSSGNAGASLAAYASRAGLSCVVVTHAGPASPMLAQIQKLGAKVLTVADKAMRWPFLTEAAARFDWLATSPFRAPVVGSHPLGIEGYKTLAFEIVEQMHGRVPDWCVMPVCYGDGLWGAWQGFKDLKERREIERLPRMVAAEIHGSLAAALASGSDFVPDVGVRAPSLAISIGATRSSYQALRALQESRGIAVPVGDANLIQWQEALAAREGIFAELSSVAPLAAIEALRLKGEIEPHHRVVAVATASGLKDIDRSLEHRAEIAPITEFGAGMRWLENEFSGGRSRHLAESVL